MLTVISERIKEENREAQTLRDLLNNRTNDFVEEVLMPYFGNLMIFVKECEILIEKENFSSLKSYESKFKSKVFFVFFNSIKQIM